MAAPPTPPTTAPTGPPTTAPPTAPATPPVTAPLESARAADDEAQINVAVAAASIHRDIKTSYFRSGGTAEAFGQICLTFTNCLEGRNVPRIVHVACYTRVRRQARSLPILNSELRSADTAGVTPLLPEEEISLAGPEGPGLRFGQSLNGRQY